LITAYGSSDPIIPDKYWGISNVGYGAYMWQVTNLKKGWIFNTGLASTLQCFTKPATNSGVQASIYVNIEPEQ